MNHLRLILAGLLLITTIQGAWFFLAVSHLSPGAWLMFNACAVANITFLAGLAVYFIFKTQVVMYMAILPLFFFGIGGLFVFPWSGPNLIAQISHLVMTANLVLLVIDLFKNKDFGSGTVGLLAGSLVFSLFIGVQQHYVYNHQDQFKKLFGADFSSAITTQKKIK